MLLVSLFIGFIHCAVVFFCMLFLFFSYFVIFMLCYRFFFFFSSRRRHTRSLCDWSSDVCSSDLPKAKKRKLGGMEGTIEFVDGFDFTQPVIAPEEWNAIGHPERVFELPKRRRRR